jgi:hypothetical protein
VYDKQFQAEMTLNVTDGAPKMQIHKLKHWENISNEQQINIKFVQTHLLGNKF